MMMSYDGLPTPDTCRLLLRPGSNMNWERVLPPAGISISGNVKRGIFFFVPWNSVREIFFIFNVIYVVKYSKTTLLRNKKRVHVYF
jgi:hypothetical protein